MFAAEAWRRSGAAPQHARRALTALVGVDLERAAGWATAARHGLDGPRASAADYATWRRRIRQRTAGHTDQS